MEELSFLKGYLDLYVLIITIASGYGIGKYWRTKKICTCHKTLIASTGFTLLYILACYFSTEKLADDFWVRVLCSYAVATSLYEVILKKIKNKLNHEPIN